MATKNSEPSKASNVGGIRPSALVDALDYSDTLDPSSLPASGRTSQWDVRLQDLYDASVAGKVGAASDGGFQYTRLATYSTANGSRAQRKVLQDRLGATYEYAITPTATGGSVLWARVKVEAAEAD